MGKRRLDERIKDLQVPARRRLSGQDVQEMLERRRGQRRRSTSTRAGPPGPHRVTPPAAYRWLRTGTVVLALAGSGVLASSIVSTDAIRAEQTSAHRAALAELIGTRDALASGAAGVLDPHDMATSLSGRTLAVQTRAQEVAQVQNGFAEILFAGNGQDTDVEVPASFVREAQHRKKMAPYFAASSWIVAQEETAYSADRLIPIEPGQVDPRFSWHTQLDDEGLFLDPGEYSWRVASIVPSTESVTQDGPERASVAVLWLCEDSGGDLLAWARASVAAGSTEFSSLSVGVTAAGQRGQERSGLDLPGPGPVPPSASAGA